MGAFVPGLDVQAAWRRATGEVECSITCMCSWSMRSRVLDCFRSAGQNMRFTVTLDRDEDGIWVVECPSIPGCVSQGRTREEAIENVKDAIHECLIVRAERGLPLTVETRQVEVAV